MQASDPDALLKALEGFADELRVAKAQFHDNPDNGRSGANAALIAVLRLLESVEPFRQEKLAAPLAALAVALGDLEQGKATPMLQSQRERHRPPVSTRESSIMAYSSATMSLLMTLGLGKEQAAKSVTRTLGTVGTTKLNSGKSITYRTVETWRARIAERTANVEAQQRYWHLLQRLGPNSEELKKTVQSGRLTKSKAVDAVLFSFSKTINLLEKST